MDDEDILIRDLMFSSQTIFTAEQMRELEQDAPWIKLTDDGYECSRGMVELIHFMFGNKTG